MKRNLHSSQDAGEDGEDNKKKKTNQRKESDSAELPSSEMNNQRLSSTAPGNNNAVGAAIASTGAPTTTVSAAPGGSHLHHHSGHLDAHALDLYSRQIGAYGIETMGALIKMRILLIGMRGLGVEVAKNLILAGPAAVTVYDPTPVTKADGGGQLQRGR